MYLDGIMPFSNGRTAMVLWLISEPLDIAGTEHLPFGFSDDV
jgi:hypothetical protein